MLIPKEGSVPLIASEMNQSGRVGHVSKRLLDCVRKKNDSRYTEQQVLKILYIFSKSMKLCSVLPAALKESRVQ